VNQPIGRFNVHTLQQGAVGCNYLWLNHQQTNQSQADKILSSSKRKQYENNVTRNNLDLSLNENSKGI